MITEFQPPAMCRVANHQTRLPRATSSLALNAFRDGHPHLLGQPVQCVSTLWVRNFFLISNLNLPRLISKPFPLVPSLADPRHRHPCTELGTPKKSRAPLSHGQP